MPTERDQLTVGLVPQGGADWIAGVIYLENIVRALLAMGDSRLGVCFITDADRRIGRGNNLTLDVPVLSYTHRAHHPWWRAGWNSAKSRRLPQSLETAGHVALA